MADSGRRSIFPQSLVALACHVRGPYSTRRFDVDAGSISSQWALTLEVPPRPNDTWSMDFDFHVRAILRF